MRIVVVWLLLACAVARAGSAGARRGRAPVQLQEDRRPGRGDVQARDRGQGHRDVGRRLHVQGPRVRPARRRDRQEGDDHRAREDGREGGVPRVPRGAAHDQPRRRTDREHADDRRGQHRQAPRVADRAHRHRRQRRARALRVPPDLRADRPGRQGVHRAQVGSGRRDPARLARDDHRLREPRARDDVVRGADRRAHRDRCDLHDPCRTRGRDQARRQDQHDPGADRWDCAGEGCACDRRAGADDRSSSTSGPTRYNDRRGLELGVRARQGARRAARHRARHRRRSGDPRLPAPLGDRRGAGADADQHGDRAEAETPASGPAGATPAKPAGAAAPGTRFGASLESKVRIIAPTRPRTSSS